MYIEINWIVHYKYSYRFVNPGMKIWKRIKLIQEKNILKDKNVISAKGLKLFQPK